MNAPTRNVLIVFAKAPRIGGVKSRLARDIGAVAAWRFYRGQLFRTVSEMRNAPGWRTILAVTPNSAADDAMWPSGVDIVAQGPGGLGTRMLRALRRFPRHSAIVVGSDVPGVTASRVAGAFRSLASADFVFGPATDGGYWLVGMRNPERQPDIFANVRWSTCHALADTTANIRAAKRIGWADELSDVDVLKDYMRWKAAR